MRNGGCWERSRSQLTRPATKRCWGGWSLTVEVGRVGVEGTGSWGVGLTRFLHDHEVTVVEVDRPNRQTRRKVGKSDAD